MGLTKNSLQLPNDHNNLNINNFALRLVLEGLGYLGIDLSLRTWRAHVENAGLHCICHS